MSLARRELAAGVSIPHARFREVKKPFGLLVRLKQPIEFDAIDGQPVDIVFLLVLPAASQLDQLNRSRRRCAQAEGSRGAATIACRNKFHRTLSRGHRVTRHSILKFAELFVWFPRRSDVRAMVDPTDLATEGLLDLFELAHDLLPRG